jgi:hypothetical protein
MPTHTLMPRAAIVHINPKTPLSGVLEFASETDTVCLVMSRLEIEELREMISDALAKAPRPARMRSPSSSATPRNK